MPPHDLSAGGDVLERVTRCARQALAAYGCHPAATVRLLNVSENATYLVEDPDAGPSVLRVHRLGYHTEPAIASELAWMEALRAEAGVRTPRVLSATGGRRIVTVADAATGEQRQLRAVRVPARNRACRGLGGALRRAGRDHRPDAPARPAVGPPAGFTRFHWDYDAAFGGQARWGRWQDGIGVGPAEREVLGRLDAALRSRLAAFGTGPQRYGLVHADTRLANLLVDGGAVSVIDFDDCRFQLVPVRRRHVGELLRAPAAGPALIAPGCPATAGSLDLPARDEAEIWTFILFRRLLLVAWIGSHTAVDIAAAARRRVHRGSCDLAESVPQPGRIAVGCPPATQPFPARRCCGFPSAFRFWDPKGGYPDHCPFRTGRGRRRRWRRSCRAWAEPSEVSTASSRGSSSPRTTAWICWIDRGEGMRFGPAPGW